MFNNYHDNAFSYFFRPSCSLDQTEMSKIWVVEQVHSGRIFVGQVLFFTCLWTATVEVRKLTKKGMKPIPSYLDCISFRSIKDLLYGSQGHFSCGRQEGEPKWAR